MKILIKMIFKMKALFLSSIMIYTLGFTIILMGLFYNYASYNNDINFEKNISGKTSFVIIDNKDIDVSELKKQPFISDIGILTYLDSSSEKYKLKLNLYKFDKGFLEINNSKIISGRLPRNKKEIVIEKWELPMFGSPKLGTNIEIDMYKGNKNNKFKLVGVIDDISYNKYRGNIAIYSSDSFSNDNTIFLGVNSRKNAILLSHYINKKIKNKKLFKEEMLNYLYKENYSKKSYYLTFITSLLVILIMLSIIIINREKLERILNILEYIGINKKMFNLFLLFGQLIYMCIGFIVSMVNISFLVPLLKDIYPNFILEKNIIPNLTINIGIVIGISLIIFLLERIILRKDKEPAKYKIKNIRRVKSIKNKMLLLFLNSYKKRLVCLSVFLIISTTIYLLFTYRENEVKKQFAEIFSTSRYKNSFDISVEPTANLDYGISKEDIDLIKNIKIDKKTIGNKVSSYKEMYCKMYVKPQDIGDKKYFIENSKEGYTKNVLKGALNEYNKRYVLKFTLFGVDSKVLKKLGVNEQTLGNNAILYLPQNSKEVLNYKIGDYIKFAYPKNYIFSDRYMNSEYYNSKFENIRLSRIVHNNPIESNYYTSNTFPCVIVSDKTFEKLTGVNSYRNILINTNKNESKLIENTVNNVFSKYSNVTIINKMKEKLLYEKQSMVVQRAGKYISLSILIIALINLANLIISEYIQRRDMYYKLYIIGMSKKMIKRNSILEAFIISIPIVVVSSLISILLQYVYYNKDVIEWTHNPQFKIYYGNYLFITFIIIVSTILFISIGLKNIFKHIDNKK